MSVELPEAGVSHEYIPDVDGGWMYIVTRTTSIEQLPIEGVQKKLAEAEKNLREAQAVVDSLKPQAESFVESAKRPEVLEIPPMEAESASSTPKT